MLMKVWIRNWIEHATEPGTLEVHCTVGLALTRTLSKVIAYEGTVEEMWAMHGCMAHWLALWITVNA